MIEYIGWFGFVHACVAFLFIWLCIITNEKTPNVVFKSWIIVWCGLAITIMAWK